MMKVLAKKKQQVTDEIAKRYSLLVASHGVLPLALAVPYPTMDFSEYDPVLPLFLASLFCANAWMWWAKIKVATWTYWLLILPELFLCLLACAGWLFAPSGIAIDQGLEPTFERLLPSYVFAFAATYACAAMYAAAVIRAKHDFEAWMEPGDVS